MKYLLIALLIGLAALEFFHHLSERRALEARVRAESQAAPQSQHGRELLKQHLHHHR